MSGAEFATQLVHFKDDLIRNIKGIRVSEDLYDDLSSDPQDAVLAQAAQSLSRGTGTNPLIERPFEYGTVITYSFDSTHWQATRFSDGRQYGVWYGSLEMETTVYETVYHWHRFILDSFADEDRMISAERRVFKVRCDALLVDLREEHLASPDLRDRHNYSFCQSLGRYLVDQRQNGLLAKSARCEGINAALFSPERLSDVRDLCYLTYRCNPARDEVRVERTRGRTWMKLIPSQLA